MCTQNWQLQMRPRSHAWLIILTADWSAHQEYAKNLWRNIQGVVGSAYSLLGKHGGNIWNKTLHSPSSTVFELRWTCRGPIYTRVCRHFRRSCSLRPSCCKTKIMIAGSSRISRKKLDAVCWRCPNMTHASPIPLHNLAQGLRMTSGSWLKPATSHDCRGTSQFTRWKRRSKAASFSMCLVYLRSPLGEPTKCWANWD